MMLLKKTRTVVRRSLPVGAGLCAAVVAVVFASSCSSDPPSSTGAVDGSSTAKFKGTTATIKHWGSFFGGKTGTNYDIRTSPTALTLRGTIAEVGSSNSTQYALMTDGSLYAWGVGMYGQLGNGRRQNSFSHPVRVHFPAGVKIASIPTDVMPYDTALAVDTTGHAWGWGINYGGELCLGDTKTYTTPVRLPLSQVTALAGASNHAVYNAHGTVYACGLNTNGELGDGSRRNSTTPVRVARLHGAAVTKLVASFANAGALLANGKYFDWGFDAHGQLGDGRTRRSSDVPVRVKLPYPVTEVAQGGSIWTNGQTIVRLSDGSLWAWGDNWAGQLGTGTRQTELVPVPIHAPAGVTFRHLASGSATSYAISTTGDVYAWGVNRVGQVGNGSTSIALTPVQVASGATSISATANNVVISVRGSESDTGQ
jgi:alpha-tubulin suppressor-like RCC1 family protein